MRIAIVGANSQIGTEVCFLLRNDGHEVIPVVRNKMGAAFLDYHGFTSLIADVTKEEDAKDAVSNCNIIVIMAYIWPNMNLSAKENKMVNIKLIKNTIENADKNAYVIYMSSIRAFSRKIDKTVSKFKLIPAYDREKQQLEKYCLRFCKKRKKKGFVFRLGHVFGVNQKVSLNIKERLAAKKTMYVGVNPEKQSNILHTVTLKEAIIKCGRSLVKPGRYTLVNSPQWTWKEVLDYYSSPITQLKFVSDEKESKKRNIAQLVMKLGKPMMKHYARIRKVLPKKIQEFIVYNYRMKKIAEEINQLEDPRKEWSMESFAYNPAPGPFISNLTETKELLREYKRIENIFAES